MAATRPRSTSARTSASTTSPARPTACRSPGWPRRRRRCRPNRRTGTEDAPVDLTQLRASLARGEKAALAAALAGIERDPDGTRHRRLLDAAWSDPRRPGDRPDRPARRRQVDPDRRVDCGLAQGWQDRRGASPSIRRRAAAAARCWATAPASPPIRRTPACFVRSMAARDRLGGLAGSTRRGDGPDAGASTTAC